METILTKGVLPQVVDHASIALCDGALAIDCLSLPQRRHAVVASAACLGWIGCTSFVLNQAVPSAHSAILVVKQLEAEDLRDVVHLLEATRKRAYVLDIFLLRVVDCEP